MDPSQQPQPQWGQQPQPIQQPIQPVAQPAPSAYQMPQQPVAVKDPNSTLGIVGLVLAFFMAPVGIVLSAVALSKSKKAGFKNTAALIGIILGSVMTVLSILVVILAIASVGNTVNDFKKDCAAKNGLVTDSGGGNLKCEYKVIQ